MALQSSFGSFNPDAKDVAPGSYLKMFDSISSFEQPSAVGVALKGAANLLDKGLEAANALVLNEGRNQAETRFQPKIEEYTGYLEDVQKKITALTKPTATGTYGGESVPGTEGGVPAGTSILPTETDPNLASVETSPSPVAASSARLDILKAGVAQGKFNDSYFRGAVANEAKDMRNNFPIGYRPEIDAMISAKMHSVQANPYIESLLKDINQHLTAGNAEKNKVSSFLLSHIKYDGMEQIYTDHEMNKIDGPEAVRRASIPIQAEQRITEAHNRLRLNSDYLKMNKDVTQQEAQGIINDILVSKNSSLTSASGIDQKLGQIIVNGNRGDYDAMDTNTKMTMARRAEALRIETEDKARAELMRPNEKGVSHASIIGPDETTKLVKFAGQQFADYRDAFYSGKLDLAASRAQTIQALGQDALYRGVISNPQIINSLALIKYAKDNGLPDAQIQTLSEPLLASTNEFRKGFDELVKNQKLNLLTPTEQVAGIEKYYTTWKDTLEHMKKVQAEKKIDLPDHINEVTKLIDGVGEQASLVNPKTPQDKKNDLAWAFFGPGNKNAFSYFKSNQFAPNGFMTPGAEALFDRFSKPDVVREIMKMPLSHQKAYEEFMTTTSREDILRKDLPKLKEAINSPNAQWQLQWNTATKNLNVVPNPKYIDTNVQPNQLSQRAYENKGKVALEQSVFSINQTLNGLKNIAETSGKKGDEVDGFVLGPVVQSLQDIGHMPGIPQSIGTTIRNAYAKKLIEAEQAKRDEEDRQKNYVPRERKSGGR
jgi:hypothetical protein